jgi:hypothetical protein
LHFFFLLIFFSLWLLFFSFFFSPGGCGHPCDFLLLTIYHFAKKKSQATWSREMLGKFSKKSSNFKEKSFEIVNFFLGFTRKQGYATIV